jgi:hypothetical protein
MIRNISEIHALIAKIRDGGFEIINDKVVSREGGFILIEGTKNRKFPVNVAAERLSRVRGR